MKINNSDHWLIPPATKPLPRDAFGNPGWQNMMSAEFGAFRVVGFLGRKGGQSVARWLCRCMCGAYEPRTAKFIKSDLAHQAECMRCSYKRERDAA